jgi:nitroreductase
MGAISSETVKGQLNWRYATKQFDAQKKIGPDDWNTLEQSLVLSPSSFGLQPWKFIVVQDQKLRAQLRAASWNQSQIVDASHLVVFAVKNDLCAADVERHLQRIAAVRKTDVAQLKSYGDMMRGFISQPGFDVLSWSTRQVYISLGFFLTTAASLGIDACPMEGIDAPAYDKLLGLDGTSYRSVVVATAGYRAATDGNAGLAKVRFDKKDIIEYR